MAGVNRAAAQEPGLKHQSRLQKPVYLDDVDPVPKKKEWEKQRCQQKPKRLQGSV
jgi:hypothetical protein